MSGMEQGIFPRSEKRDEDLEEERRLFYVGVTRAMDELYLTTCATRIYHGQFNHMEPSLFLREADKSVLEISGDAPSNLQYLTTNRTNDTNRTGHKNHTNYDNRISRPTKKTSSDGRWSIGDRIFNEDYGYGEVCGIKEEEEAGPVISVQFETGSQIKFLSLAQSKKYMKIKE
jgi:DNA helicase-2/ATP-dependent DNA helicase PcrA